MQPRFPEYPRIAHLKESLNRTADDLESVSIFDLIGKEIKIFEKLDGANVGFTWNTKDDCAMVRNREHILSKNYQKNTKSKIQFRPLWNFVAEHKKDILWISKELSLMPIIYGEWLYAEHSLPYNGLKSLFYAFDIYDPESNRFLTEQYAEELCLNRFQFVPLLWKGILTDVSTVESLLYHKSLFSENNVEGIVIRQGRHRYKWVSPEFKRKDTWLKESLTRNKVVK